MSITTHTERLSLSPTDAARTLGIGRSTLFALRARGELKARKLGTRTLIPAAELSRYAESLPEARFHAHVATGGGDR